MGLDLCFNRAAAITAGLQLFMERNGTDESIAIAEEDNDPVDAEYLAWLKAESEIFKVPGTELHVTNDGVGDNICIRANKWGRVYAPMTEWLKANNITWGEF